MPTAGGADTGDELDSLGPIDYLVVEFPSGRFTGGAMPLLADLVERGTIRILDLLLLKKDQDGQVRGIAIPDFDGDEYHYLRVFEGVSSGLIDNDDQDAAGAVLAPGAAAGIVVYENVWAAPFAAALRRAGGELVASGRVPVQAVLAALDATEPADS
jgi:hypothetical protein